MSTWFLVGGGPSLRGFDWNRLVGKRVIAINRAYEVLPDAEIVYWSDWRFYDWHREGIRAHRAKRKITALRPGDRDHAYDLRRDPIEVWRFTGTAGLDSAPMSLRHGNGAGYSAINVACHFSMTKGYLLGYDMRAGPGGEANWHDGYKVFTPPRAFVDNMLPFFPTLVEPLRYYGIEVFNLNPDSAIECFPKRPIDEVL